MSRFNPPRVEPSDARKALELHNQAADRTQTKRTSRTLSTRPHLTAEPLKNESESEDTP